MHTNFRKWQKTIHNKDFTEIALHLNTNGGLPDKRVFAKVINYLDIKFILKTIIESIKDEKEWYLIHPYTHGAVSV